MPNRITTTILSCIVLVVIVLALSPSCQKCFSEQPNKQTASANKESQSDSTEDWRKYSRPVASANKESQSDSTGTLRRFGVCLGVSINDTSPVITAVATLIIAIFTGTLWTATNRQAQLTREAFTLDKRAFIFNSGNMQYHEKDLKTGQYNWRIRPNLMNTGETPTKGMRMFVECEIRNSIFPAGHDFRHSESNVAVGFIAPKGYMEGGLVPGFDQAPITPQDILDAQTGKKFIYIWGWVKYFDVFTGTPEHITRYCWSITVAGDPTTYIPNTPGQPPTPGTLTFRCIPHSEYNCADEGCEQPLELTRVK